jgi:ribosome silencing factor RsfS/YbeB/iojap
VTIEERIERIVDLLDSKKAEEIEVFNLENIDYIAKRVVIANSLGGKHTQALFDQMKEELKPRGETFFGADESDEWIVVDLGEIVVHLMTPHYRQRYSLEAFLEELRAGKTRRLERPF